ncbi:putative outer membrane protein [wastewater metagenome]|uniref:Putative outer membrane protein n=2 Tax=unclassified sequences TaxID=12908 RepID=A0A5B8RGD8_9ZZZZ|nr:outer membrane protein transport protein [Arhodomonas sp. KWT]QEA06564.1 putative outer membrane protein [uncultured organism]
MSARHRGANRLIIATSALTLAGAAASVHATGFQIREQSAKALANSLASAAAGAEDVSFMAYNPAALGNIDGTQVAGSLAYIDAEFDMNDGRASPYRVPLNGPDDGTPYDGSKGNSGETALVPSFAVKTQLSDSLDAGLAVYSPYGLSTDYDHDWIGRYQALETDLKVVDIQPTLNFRVTDRLSLAGGLRVQYADATLSNALDLGGLSSPAQPGQHDGFAEVTGDDWGVGYTLGALFQVTDRTRVGVSYRSKVDLTLKGDAEFSATDATSRAILANAQAGGQFTDTSGKADLTTPASLNLGIYHQATDRLALMFNAEWTEWSSFDELVVRFGDNTPNSVTEENWENTWALSTGASYALTGRWTLRGGIGMDESPVPNARHRTPRVPDVDRRWLSAGATFSPTERLSITGAWMHIFFDDGDVNLEDESRGNLSGTYEGTANVFAVSADYRF